jgi:hypothetical protein
VPTPARTRVHAVGTTAALLVVAVACTVVTAVLERRLWQARGRARSVLRPPGGAVRSVSRPHRASRPSLGAVVTDGIADVSGSVPPGRYRHFRGGEYQVLLTARDTETEEPVVVYSALYGERGHWIRSVADFTAHVDRDGYAGPRFVRIGDPEDGSPT